MAFSRSRVLLRSQMNDTGSNNLYHNRELGLLAFNRRVLAQAEDPTYPLLERLRFLCIVSSNLDEFFEIRVAGLKAEIEKGSTRVGPDLLPATDIFTQVARDAHELVASQYRLLNEDILPRLAAEGIRFLRRTELTSVQAEWMHRYFLKEVMPVLTPIGLDSAHPFPRVLNKSLNFVVQLEGLDAFGRNSGIAVVQAPRVLPRIIRLPQDAAEAPYDFVFLSSVLHAHMGELFPGMQVGDSHQFRVTRNSELFLDEEEIKDLRSALRGELPSRRFGDEVRLEVAASCTATMSRYLLDQFHLDDGDLYCVDGPVNLARLIYMPDVVDRPDLKFSRFVQSVPGPLKQQEDIFAAIRSEDILLHHPFQSFRPVLEFLDQAARDPAVVAIKQTVYRTGSESEVMEKLIVAARNGKEVTVVVELLARFDEEANINWAQRLEDAGAHVVYGVVGYKTHAKMLMVVRREDETLRRYVHLSTGNYHSRTTMLYTDLALFTCNEAIGEDVHEVFSLLTGLGRAAELKCLWEAPFTLHREVTHAIQREIDHARAGRKARIIAKMNALLEPAVVAALCEASKAGVEIDLIVRGVCALRPGIPGVSDNIRVRSIVGRFLEHARIFYFYNAGAEDVYLSSADWMDRNFFRRVEVAWPILDRTVKQRIIDEGLLVYLRDTVRAWEMKPGGDYARVSSANGGASNAQDTLLDLLAPPAVSAGAEHVEEAP